MGGLKYAGRGVTFSRRYFRRRGVAATVTSLTRRPRRRNKTNYPRGAFAGEICAWRFSALMQIKGFISGAVARNGELTALLGENAHTPFPCSRFRTSKNAERG